MLMLLLSKSILRLCFGICCLVINNPYDVEFIGCVPMDGHVPFHRCWGPSWPFSLYQSYTYEFIGSVAMDGYVPCQFIGFVVAVAEVNG